MWGNGWRKWYLDIGGGTFRTHNRGGCLQAKQLTNDSSLKYTSGSCSSISKKWTIQWNNGQIRRWQRNKWSTSLSTDTSGIQLQTQKCMQNASWDGQEDLTSGNEYIEHTKLSSTKELGGKTGVLVGLDLPSAGGGTEAGVQSPHQGNCLSQRGNI